MIRERHDFTLRRRDSLAGFAWRFYNTGIVSSGPVNAMDFEDFGRRIDEEVTRLRRYVEQEIAPESERRGAQFLREVSEKLSELAGKLEARTASRRPPDTPPSNPPSNPQS